jgi:hypothetical protein
MHPTTSVLGKGFTKASIVMEHIGGDDVQLGMSRMRPVRGDYPH